MNIRAWQALAVIQGCLETGRYRVLVHFTQSMDKRGLFWPDIQAVAASASSVRYDGLDEFDRPRWLLSGKTTDGQDLEIVCVIDKDEEGNLTVFITAYWV